MPTTNIPVKCTAHEMRTCEMSALEVHPPQDTQAYEIHAMRYTRLKMHVWKGFEENLPIFHPISGDAVVGFITIGVAKYEFWAVNCGVQHPGLARCPN